MSLWHAFKIYCVWTLAVGLVLALSFMVTGAGALGVSWLLHQISIPEFINQIFLFSFLLIFFGFTIYWFKEGFFYSLTRPYKDFQIYPFEGFLSWRAFGAFFCFYIGLEVVSSVPFTLIDAMVSGSFYQALTGPTTFNQSNLAILYAIAKDVFVGIVSIKLFVKYWGVEVEKIGF